MNDLVPLRAFEAFISAAVGVVAFVWLVFDAINFVRSLRAHSADPTARDRRFGYEMGLIIATVGITGVIKHYLP
jgi:hypothetical protein